MPTRHAASLHLPRILPAGLAGDLRAYVLALLALLLLAGCEKLPRPFQPGDKTGNPLLAPIEGQNLEVLPLQGAAPLLPDRGATQIASALSEAGLPATVGQRTAQSRLLLGTAEVIPNGGFTEQLRLRWEVYAPGGSLLHIYLQEAELPQGHWVQGEAGTLAKIGREAASLLAAAASGPEVVAVRVEPTGSGERRTVAIWGLSGAPGDGGQAVPRALASIMTQRGFLVVDDLTPGGFAIDGVMRVDSATGGQQGVRLVWRVLAGQEGEFLGQVEQENVVPAGSLDGAWGELAAIVANAAADGLVDLMAEAGKL